MRGGSKPASSCLPSVQPARLAARSGWPVPPRTALHAWNLRRFSPPPPQRLSSSTSAPPHRHYYFVAATSTNALTAHTGGIPLLIPFRFTFSLSLRADPSARIFSFPLEYRYGESACVVSPRDFQFVADTILVPSLVRSRSFARATSFPTRVSTSSCVLPPNAPTVPLTLFRHRRRLRATPARERGKAYLENTSVSGMMRGEEAESQRMPKFGPRLPSPPSLPTGWTSIVRIPSRSGLRGPV